MISNDIKKLFSSFAFYLSTQKEVKKVLFKGVEWFRREKTNYEFKTELLTKPFLINIKAIIEKSKISLYDADDIIYKKAKEILNIFNKITIDDELLFLMAKCNSSMNIYLCTSFATITVNNLTEINNIKQFNKRRYYRGQTDFEYNLLPSFYRHLNVSNGEVISIKTIEEKYRELGLIDKYKELMNKDIIHVNSPMMSFIQHSISYSPFLDITESNEIAAIFATSPKNINLNEYKSKDAALYCFIEQGIKMPGLVGQHSTTDIARGLNIFMKSSLIKFNEKIRNKYLFEMCYEDFKICYKFTSSQTNDRAIAQRGYFFFIVKGCIISGYPLIPFDQIAIIKCRIPKEKKKEIYDSLISGNKGKRLNIETLMNPYSYFFD